MSVAPPPATYTATNDLNIIKNIFVPQYQFSNGYFHASVNTQLPGNVTVGDSTTNFLMTVNNRVVMTLSDLQNWSYFYATSNVVLNSNAITTVSKLTFLGGSLGSTYTIDATTGTINVSQYSLKSVPLTLSGGLPAWAAYPASGNVNMNSFAVYQLSGLVMSSGAAIIGLPTGTIAFSNSGVERMRITPSGGLSVGTIAQYAGYSLNVSGGSILQTPVRILNLSGQTESNSFFVQTVPSSSTNYDVRIGALGPNTNLIFCTGTPDTFASPFANLNQAKLTPGGNFLLSNGYFSNVDPTQPNAVGGVGLQNSNVTALLNISVGDFSTLALASSNRCITFIVTAATGNTINLTLPGSTVPKGTYWILKNVVGSTQTVNVTGGTIVNTLATIANNGLATIVYSGAGGNYYAL